MIRWCHAIQIMFDDYSDTRLGVNRSLYHLVYSGFLGDPMTTAGTSIKKTVQTGRQMLLKKLLVCWESHNGLARGLRKFLR